MDFDLDYHESKYKSKHGTNVETRLNLSIKTFIKNLSNKRRF